MPAPTAVLIELTDDERSMLVSWTRRRTSAQALALRARIVLMAAEGLWSNREIAEALEISRPTVTKWRNRFAQRRLEGLADEPRPGKPRTITDEQVEAVVTKTLESAPKNATHWSTRSMAREVGMTPDAVMRIWHAFGLQPHRQETWKLSKDPLFIEKVHDICGLYLNPPERAAGQDSRINLGCCLRHGAFVVAWEDEPPQITSSEPDVSLMFFLMALFTQLQRLGTVPAIDLDEYGRSLRA